NQTQAMILNDAYMCFITDTAGFEDAESRIKVIYNKNYESSIKKEVNEEYLNSEGRVFTVLLNGVDTRGSTIANSNSDTNILMTVNMDTHQILMISTPRDYFVPLSISGNVRDKLTHSGAYGVDVTMDTLEMLYGVNIDDYVRINFDGFMDVIDALGGITVYSDYEFDGFDNDVVNMTYHFNQGYNELNGKQALLFARERHAFTDGDRQRGKNQMAVIEGMIDKALSPQILKNYTNIWSEVSDCVVTSMDYDEIADFVKTQLSDGTNWNVVKYSVTGTDSSSTTYSTGSTEVYVMIPDEETVNQAREYLRQIYAGQTVVIPE
ncbi:MAG: LCP family protein, partial [Lachnospiraceae bacterium]|nr:LCP family protein [Lachnospiraceae bacterium]